MLDIPAQMPLHAARPSEQAISNGTSGTVREWIVKIEPSVIWRLSMFLNTHKDVKLEAVVRIAVPGYNRRQNQSCAFIQGADEFREPYEFMQNHRAIRGWRTDLGH